jgi:hypothetical protein
MYSGDCQLNNLYITIAGIGMPTSSPTIWRG